MLVVYGFISLYLIFWNIQCGKFKICFVFPLAEDLKERIRIWKHEKTSKSN